MTATIVATHIGVPGCGSTSIRCPHCGRHLLEAEEIKNAKLRCKSCRDRLIINLGSGTLTILLDNETV